MAITEPPEVQNRCYSLNEAVNLMKEMDKYPTGSRPIKWVDCKTKKPVSIGYN